MRYHHTSDVAEEESIRQRPANRARMFRSERTDLHTIYIVRSPRGVVTGDRSLVTWQAGIVASFFKSTTL